MTVPTDGYAWWYVDALSDDGREGLTVIAFLGSVFSPYYAWRRARAPTDPLDHCAMNVAIYRAGGSRWAMTERRKPAVYRDAATLGIGPSTLKWNGQSFQFTLDEVAVPVPARLRGTITLHPAALPERTFALTAEGSHHWSPVAPVARVEVDFSSPRVRWQGAAYMDMNSGDAPLETGFTYWHWSRAAREDATLLLYDTNDSDGRSQSLALRCRRSGEIEPFDAPPTAILPSTRWRLARATRAETGAAGVVRTLEDAPFYARSLIDTKLLGRTGPAMHESLSLTRFRQRWVQCLLPFRMPRSR